MVLKTYLIALPVFLIVDAVWLGIIAKDLYSKQIGFIMTPNINWVAAGIFYLIFIFGLTVFVILPALEKNSRSHAIIFGALFGLVTYATYDLTNQATLKDWPLLVTLIDLAWGAFIASFVSFVTFQISVRFL